MTVGVGSPRDSSTLAAHGCRSSARRAERMRSRIVVFQSAPSIGASISATTTSIIPSRSSSLLATCLNSAIGTTPSSCASRRMLSGSTPPSSARATAAARIRSLVRGSRARAVSSIFVAIPAPLRARSLRRSALGFDKCTPYTLGWTNRCTPYTTRVRGVTMKAIVQDRYGEADVLEFRDVEEPQVGEQDVLIRVRAAGAGPDVWHIMAGKPYMARPVLGWSRPKIRIRGWDVAGTVEAVGSAVTEFERGDEVMGEAQRGSFAELTVAPADKLVRKPSRISF